MPGLNKHKPVIHYDDKYEHLERNFLMLCNHNAFFDFSVAEKVLEKTHNHGNYVVAIDGFLNREWLLRTIGCICKRKFTNDIVLPRQLKRVAKMGNCPVVYPEARYSLCGTNSVLPQSLGKLVKFIGLPVVVLICHGHHINHPFWNTSHERGVCPTEADVKVIVDNEEIKTLDVDEINKRIVDAFYYDDFKWQLDNKVSIKDETRAEGLHRVLYKCPECGEEHEMTSYKDILKCNKCGSTWHLNEFGQLIQDNKLSKFTHIPDWFEWERECVKKEVIAGSYSSGELECSIDSIPKNKFVHLGKGKLIHDMEGMRVFGITDDGEEFSMIRTVPQMYSVHIEYQYLFKHGDAIDLNSEDDTWYCYLEGKFNVTKMYLATEELYLEDQRKKGVKVKKGLA